MSETHCTNCDGRRGFCAKCGKPRRPRRGGDVGGGCCPYARVIPCRGHVATTYACDVCLASTGQARPLHWRESLYACEPCQRAWKDYQATLADRFIEDRQAARREGA